MMLLFDGALLGIPLIILAPLIIGLIVFFIAASLRRVVPPDRIDIVVRTKSQDIYCGNKEYFPEGTTPCAVYYNIPSWVPGVGMKVRQLTLEMLEIKVDDFTAFDENRARFNCDIVAFVAIKDGQVAAMRMPRTTVEMSAQLSQVLWATMRDSTTKMTVHKIINNRSEIIRMIRGILTEAIENWGLSLKDIEIVGFKDAPGTKVVTNISSINEQEIETDARQKNADMVMKAQIKEAEADEKAKMRQIERDESVGKRQEKQKQAVAKEAKIAMEENLEVTKVEKVKNQQISKEQAEVLAEQEKVVARIKAEQLMDVEKINKEQKLLEGEGDKLRKEQQAKGDAATVREPGLAKAEIIEAQLVAEAKGKDKLSEALNKFGKNAYDVYKVIREIEKDEAVYKELAKSISYADTKVFLGGEGNASNAFNFGKSFESLKMSNPEAFASAINKNARPNDLGFQDIDYKKMIAVIDRTPKIKEAIRKAIDKERAEEETEVKKETMSERITEGISNMNKGVEKTRDKVTDSDQEQTTGSKRRKILPS